MKVKERQKVEVHEEAEGLREPSIEPQVKEVAYKLRHETSNIIEGFMALLRDVTGFSLARSQYSGPEAENSL